MGECGRGERVFGKRPLGKRPSGKGVLAAIAKAGVAALTAAAILAGLGAEAMIIDTKKIHVSVGRGRSLGLVGKGSMAPHSCQVFSAPALFPGSKPALGELTSRTESMPVTRNIEGNSGCLAKTVPITFVSYRAGGTAGQDHFDFYLQAVDGTYRYDVLVDVR